MTTFGGQATFPSTRSPRISPTQRRNVRLSLRSGVTSLSSFGDGPRRRRREAGDVGIGRLRVCVDVGGQIDRAPASIKPAHAPACARRISRLVSGLDRSIGWMGFSNSTFQTPPNTQAAAGKQAAIGIAGPPRSSSTAAAAATATPRLTRAACARSKSPWRMRTARRRGCDGYVGAGRGPAALFAHDTSHTSHGTYTHTHQAPLFATDQQQQDGGRPSSALTIVGEDVEAAPGKVATDGAASPQQRPAASSVLWSVCPFILVAETCTRLSYYGLAGSLVLLFQSKLGLSNSEADNHYAVWSGLCYCTPLIGPCVLGSRSETAHPTTVFSRTRRPQSQIIHIRTGGWLADTHWGRFRTIATCSCIYLLGLLLLIITVWPGGPAAANNGASASALIFTAIYIVAAGDGGVKPNVCTFGADQFDRRVPEQRRELESFL